MGEDKGDAGLESESGVKGRRTGRWRVNLDFELDFDLEDGEVADGGIREVEEDIIMGEGELGPFGESCFFSLERKLLRGVLCVELGLGL